MSKKANHIKHNPALWVLLGAIGFGLAAPIQAMAEDAPFQIEKGQWMSFDHYSDADKRGHIAQPAPEQAADTTAIPADPNAPASAQPIKQAVASPTRPVELPILPGINKGYGMEVKSTQDPNQAELVVPAPDANGAAAPADLRLSDKSWQAPSRMDSLTQLDENGDTVDLPINVRASYLPDTSVTPNPSPERASAQQAGHAQMKKIIQQRLARQQQADEKDKIAPTPAQSAAQAAVDAYKKQQLDAIQSDRETLKALQDAVHSLGLDKQLDFMSGAKGNVNAQDTASAPAQTTVR